MTVHVPCNAWKLTFVEVATAPPFPFGLEPVELEETNAPELQLAPEDVECPEEREICKETTLLITDSEIRL